jgi:cytochrome c553
MKPNISRSKYKIALCSTAVLLALLTGCSDNGEKKQKAAENTTTSTKADENQKIEVVKNENAQEIKVAQKENDGNQSKSYYYDYNVKSGYDPNSEPANHDASVREKARSAVDANLHIRSPYEKIQVSMALKEFSKNFIVKCSACHNDYANGIIGPSLLGKDANYIFDKIAAFKTGKSKNVLMDGLISQMDDKEIQEIADEIYQFNNILKEMRK